jgi:hypothetical protein
MTFVPGQSGNPGGRSKALKEIQELAREHSGTALKALSYIAEHGESEQARVAAANALLDRAFGKPPQAVAAEHTEAITITWWPPQNL